MTTDIDLDAIRRLTEAATPAPWTAHPDGLVWPERIGDPVSGSVLVEDAEFIAAARSAVPALLAEVRRMRAEWDRLVNERAELLAVVRAAEDLVVSEHAALRASLGKAGEVLIAAVDALPNMQEPCDTCSSTASGCAECRSDNPAMNVGEVMRLVEVYGTLRGAAGKLGDLGAVHRHEASLILDKIRAAVTR